MPVSTDGNTVSPYDPVFGPGYSLDGSRGGEGQSYRVAGPPIAEPGVAFAPDGYTAQPGDVTLLARMMFTEASNSLAAYPGLGWAAINRIGSRDWGSHSTLSEVIFSRNQFQGVGPGGNSLWWKSENPSQLTGANAASYAEAHAVAERIFAGTLPDPTDGATSFYSGPLPAARRADIAAGTLKETAKEGAFHFLAVTKKDSSGKQARRKAHRGRPT